MVSKIIGFFVVLGCLTVSVLRGIGVMDGDFIIPLILLSQMFILGYIVNIATLLAKDIIVRYNKGSRQNSQITTMHTWN